MGETTICGIHNWEARSSSLPCPYCEREDELYYFSVLRKEMVSVLGKKIKDLTYEEKFEYLQNNITLVGRKRWGNSLEGKKLDKDWINAMISSLDTLPEPPKPSNKWISVTPNLSFDVSGQYRITPSYIIREFPYYVIGNGEAIPFRDKESAELFLKQNQEKDKS